jgi:hypothetical protein
MSGSTRFTRFLASQVTKLWGAPNAGPWAAARPHLVQVAEQDIPESLAGRDPFRLITQAVRRARNAERKEMERKLHAKQVHVRDEKVSNSAMRQKVKMQLREYAL